jgi:hypothetical protein
MAAHTTRRARQNKHATRHRTKQTQRGHEKERRSKLGERVSELRRKQVCEEIGPENFPEQCPVMLARGRFV